MTNGATELVSIDTQLDQLLVEPEAIRTVAQNHHTDIKTLCTKLIRVTGPIWSAAQPLREMDWAEMGER